ncbi:hypothetical protein HYH02_014814 [Chlamydomonas schloesseri]|uniref:Uncharacterized protein n=1 Tax=Chlamydomonas schloesseri TaxID=2026947 RepID=A0A835VRD2_9CHLO|nr:hypothetical protein HYH02_014814 [Chlamydomonas schloesseri]|eukprot:KAG2426387.1 hypothetical protein HYH02_014814 [Chlamydomonas schloesseri]
MLSSSRALGPTDPSPCGDDGEQAKRRRGRPRKTEPPVDMGSNGIGEEAGPVAKRSRGRPPRDASAAQALEAQPRPARSPSQADRTSDSDNAIGHGMKRRGRPPRSEPQMTAAGGGSLAARRDGSGSTTHGSGDHDGDMSPQAATTGTLYSRRGRPRRGGPEQQVEEALNTAAGGVGTAMARRGRPPLQKASREAELQVMLQRELRLKPTELRPPPSSWRQLRDGAAPETLRARVVMLKDALGLEVVRRMAQRCPHLLHWHEATLLSKLDDLTLGLGLSRQQLLGAVLAYPRLLQSAPNTLLARVALLQAELRLPLKTITAMVAAQPPLLCMSPSTLRLRADLLHEAASLLPQWRHELSRMAPSTLGRMLRCSEGVLNRLVYTYLRVSTNGKKFHEIRSMKRITTIPAAEWHEKNPLFQEWLDNGARDRASGIIVQWDGWWRGPQTQGPGQGQAQGEAAGGAGAALPQADGSGRANWWGMPNGGLRWTRTGERPHPHSQSQSHPALAPDPEEPTAGRPGPASSSGWDGGGGSGGVDGAPPGSLGARGSSGLMDGLGFGDSGLRLTSSELWQRYWELGGGGDGKRWTPPGNDDSAADLGLGKFEGDDGSDEEDDDDRYLGPEDGRGERRA